MQQFGIVRDKATGLPKSDDPSSAHPFQIGMCSSAERKALGFRDGPFAMTADGHEPIEQRGEDFYALEDMRAVGQIITFGEAARSTVVHKVTPRTDYKAGQKIDGQLTVIAREN